MFWAILGGGAVVAAIVLWFLWTLLGWVGLTFGIIAFVGVAGVGWYAYVLYGKAADLWNQMEVVGKRVAAIGAVLAEIKLPEDRSEAAVPARRDTVGTPVPAGAKGTARPSRAADRDLDPALDADDEFFLP